MWPASWANAFQPKRYNNIVDSSTPGRSRADHVGDVSGDGYADLTVLKSDGTLHYFANNVNSHSDSRPFWSPENIGEGFAPFTLLRSADVSGDSYADMIGVQSDGSLHYFPNNVNSNPGHPYGNGINIGSGFQEFNNILLADVSGDGFDTFSQLRLGDVSGDGYADLLGVKPDGTLLYYPNNINSGPPFGLNYNIGQGFNVFSKVITGDISGDGYADLLGVKPDGTLHHFANNINSNPNGWPYTASTLIGSGFEMFGGIL